MLLPGAKAMVLCEDVLPGPEGTGNVHLMNVFSTVRPRGESPFPYRLPQLSVFLALTDASGQLPGRILARRADDDEPVFASPEHVIAFAGRLQVKWVVFRLADCPLPSPGRYVVEFYCRGQLVCDVPFDAVEE